MKYIVRPQDLDLGSVGKFSFENFVKHLINTDNGFNETGPGIRAGMKIEIMVMGESKIIEMPNEYWEMLSAVSENPSRGYPRLVSTSASGETQEMPLGRLLLPFIDAIKDAQDVPPEI